MKCPVCDEQLREVERQGVQVDICPSCKGVWLDRGELDKILEVAASGDLRSDRASADASPRPSERGHDDHDRDREHRDDDDHRNGDHGSIGRREGGGKKRRGSWLGDILGGIGGD
jgi:Zn-finger nucleic acid-binding protein